MHLTVRLCSVQSVLNLIFYTLRGRIVSQKAISILSYLIVGRRYMEFVRFNLKAFYGKNVSFHEPLILLLW